MSEYGNRSRRLLLRAAILFAFVLIGWFAFQLLPDQRLNPIERQLLGQWSFPSLDNPTIIKQIVFYTDRTFDLSSSNGATGSGTWKAGGNNLILSLKVEDEAMPRYVPEEMAWYLRPSFDEPFGILDVDKGQVRLRGAENEALVLKRIKSDASSAH